MANRYWVGGVGVTNWGDSGWSTTSGGPAGAAVPAISDDVFFDANSGSATVPIFNADAFCNSLNMTGFAGHIEDSGTHNVLTVATSYTGVTGPTWTDSNYMCKVLFNGAVGGTIDFAGQHVFGLEINGAGSWTLQNDVIGLVSGGSNSYLKLTQGTLNCNNKNISVDYAIFTGTNTRALTGTTSTTLTIQSNGKTNDLDAGTTTNLTWNAPTSIKFTGAGASTADLGNLTLNQVWISKGTSSNTHTFNNNGFTCTELKDDGTAAHTVKFSQGKTFTFTTWSVSGTTGGFGLITIDTTGTATQQYTLSKASGTVAPTYLTIKSSNATGGATFTADATNVNGGHNTGWNFPSAASSNMLAIF